MVHTDGTRTIANAPTTTERKARKVESKRRFYDRLEADRAARVKVVYGLGMGGAPLSRAA